MTLPAGLINTHQWLNWKGFINKDSGKTDKIPVDAYGKPISGKEPANWKTYEQVKAIAAASNGTIGIGFQFSTLTPFFGIDLDDCINPDGSIQQWALDIIKYIPGYTEYSPSVTGLHIMGYAHYDHVGINQGQIECYTRDRFFTVTGNQVPGTSVDTPDCTQNYIAFTEQFKAYQVAERDTTELTDKPVPESNPIMDDDTLLEKMYNSESTKASLGTACSNRALIDGDPTVLGQFFPHASKPFDHSGADQALMNHLAFWTGKDEKRMERLFSRTALGQRDKWKTREQYRRDTIKKASAITTRTYRQVDELPAPVAQEQQPTAGPGQAPVPAPSGEPVPQPAPIQIAGLRHMPSNMQPEHFSGCVYIADSNKIMTPSGMTYGKEQFDILYGGWNFEFDSIGDKTNKSAWDVFTKSQAWVFGKVDHTSFKPQHKGGTITQDDLGHTYVNTYRKPIIPSTPGDASPFLTHMSKLFPDTGDHDKFMSYIAAVVQYQGTKFMWAPIVQGVQGNGKSLIGECLKRAIGKRYVYSPEAQDITNKFNAWLEGNILIIIEEININLKGKYEMMEVLKPMITADEVEIQQKGVDKRMAGVCANFLMLTNYKDALIKTKGDRRHAVFYCPQQRPEDLIRDGLTIPYFNALWRWLENGGYAIVTNYLQNYPIPAALNPTMDCKRAPETTSTKEAIAQSLGAAEHAILTAIEEERIGFMGDWVSSTAISRLLKEERIRKPPQYRGEMMRTLGYEYHPALKNGRTSSVNSLDGTRTRLFVKTGSEVTKLSMYDVLPAYLDAQGRAPATPPMPDDPLKYVREAMKQK